MGYDSCATCCAVFSLLGIVHLVLFGRMFSEKAISFAIIAVENGWDGEKKAKACYNGAIIYTATLFLSVLARVYFRRNDAAKAALLYAQRAEEIQGLLVPPTLSTGSTQY
ncbi:hypothetical protein LPMP_181160 [Leishmania panamensis]|uniref:Transmembrane protein n=7 Tax=Viannia TaxID=37616 RepID=A4H9M6_LEIBR|nr:conserved hypothetical protein [Leishmania braziliensis MHOM/BR/75/M2904]XP_010697950.1 hypothetical protein LPMP_181160 [Leishmania panamensis]KAI5691037.1 hypothetical protein MNV84_02598 [Leishmania braziliensis]CCM14502.1 hypothetical protein, conserved [Leishmania guyanensis]AIN97297.1 hypothetical protein LPMP_181160 [Leishmania panamensis]CAJ2470431.1 unnamed protein product [Leishmania braziliensis]CAJ2470938.1 unnamed protein product [Leishmania braziliensis]